MTSRIFVKNLPPGITEFDVRSTFEKKGSITDIRIIPKRRIGYIGYKTPEEAEGAVKYFNRSYIRTSKIAVEIARPIEPKATSHPTRHTLSNTEDFPDRKRKRDEVEQPNPNSGKKFENFLQGFEATAPTGVDATTNTNEDPPMGEGDEEEEVIQAATDDDWLRSKTNRTLDFINDVDELSGGREPVKLTNAVPDEPPARLESVEEESVPSGPSALDVISQHGRLFLRNLPYSATEADIKARFTEYGAVSEVHVPLDSKTNAPKGFAYVQFEDSTQAVAAFEALDGQGFQGRLLHILPSAPKRESKLDEFAIAKLPLKKQRAIKKKTDASSQFNWNSMYMNTDAIMSSVAHRLGVSKSELLDPTNADSAVKQAHAETAVIQETKAFLQENGVNLDAFNQREKDDRILLIKNFPFSTSGDEIRTMLSEFGDLKRMLFPPAGTIAIAEFVSSPSGKKAFAALAYRRFKDSILFLEKGPKGLFDGASAQTISIGTALPPVVPVSTSEIKNINPTATEAETTDSATIFIRNLNFSTTNEILHYRLSSLEGFQWCRVKTKTDAKRPGQVLSMGFGFAGFETPEAAQAAVKVLNGTVLEAHTLSVSLAKRDPERTTGIKKEKPQNKKIIIKNLPFEATKKDVHSLFGKYGTLRTIRMPKKLGQKTRGFAFAEFVTAREAENAMQALKDTHLLGRRLVLDYATADAETAEEEIEKMSKKMEKQTQAMAIQALKVKSKEAVRLTGDGAVDNGEGDDL